MSRMSRNAPGDSEADNYKYETPNNTIMIRGLAQHITENDVSVCIHYMRE
jgi:RNA-binding protein 5/10